MSVDWTLAKSAVAQHALNYLEPDMIIGVGSGSTVHYFIEQLAKHTSDLKGAVSTSVETTRRLKALDLPVYDLNTVDSVPLYFDGADEVDARGMCLKGGGGALTQEKIVAAAADRWVCMVDHSKCVERLGQVAPISIEVIQSARSYVGRALVQLGMNPVYRSGCLTDQGHIIIDAYQLPTLSWLDLECEINQIPGVVAHGLFATHRANTVIVGAAKGEVSVQSIS